MVCATSALRTNEITSAATPVPLYSSHATSEELDWGNSCRSVHLSFWRSTLTDLQQLDEGQLFTRITRLENTIRNVIITLLARESPEWERLLPGEIRVRL